MIRIRHNARRDLRRPVMLGIAGDSAAGKSTLARGIAQSLGPGRCVLLAADDYHRYDRPERAGMPFSALHPRGHHLDILAQHLQLLAIGQPVLKPVYDHRTGQLTRPRLVEPAEIVIVEGLLPLHDRLARSCFDVTVYLEPAEELRRSWKLLRDTASRGYTADQVTAELAAREPDSAGFVRPQREHADIVVRFRAHGAELLLGGTIDWPDLLAIPYPGLGAAIARVPTGGDAATDTVCIADRAPAADRAAAEDCVWDALSQAGPLDRRPIGWIDPETRSTALAITQMVLLGHILAAAR